MIHKVFKKKDERVFRFLASTRTLFFFIKIPGFTINDSTVHIVKIESSVSFYTCFFFLLFKKYLK